MDWIVFIPSSYLILSDACCHHRKPRQGKTALNDPFFLPDSGLFLLALPMAGWWVRGHTESTAPFSTDLADDALLIYYRRRLVRRGTTSSALTAAPYHRMRRMGYLLGGPRRPRLGRFRSCFQFRFCRPRPSFSGL